VYRRPFPNSPITDAKWTRTPGIGPSPLPKQARGLQVKPSVGLEPTTLPLPSRRGRFQLMHVCLFMLQTASFLFSGAADCGRFHAG